MQVWVNCDDEENLAKLSAALGKAVDANKDKELKAFVVVMTMCEGCVDCAKTLGKTAPKNIAVTYIANTDAAVKNYKINTDKEVKNTVLVYRDKKIVANLVNVVADEKGLASLKEAIGKATN